MPEIPAIHIIDGLTIYKTQRGHSLLWMYRPAEAPVLTVENYLKWYELYLIQPRGNVEELDFGRLEEVAGADTPYCDHAPNPKVVIRLADLNGWIVDMNALDMIIGRWECEYKNNYGPTSEGHNTEDKKEIVHIRTQDNQPYGSERRCCN